MASAASENGGGLLTPAKLAEVLTAAGGAVTEDQIRGDCERGVPHTADGMIPLLAYIAWVHREVVKRGH
jgi:hypothetical protein